MANCGELAKDEYERQKGCVGTAAWMWIVHRRCGWWMVDDGG